MVAEERTAHDLSRESHLAPQLPRGGECGRHRRDEPDVVSALASSTSGSMAVATHPVIAAARSGLIRALPAE